MAENFVLEVQPRSVVGKKVSQLRRQGLVPATVYGPKVEPISIQIPYRPLQLMLLKAGGTNLIELDMEGKKTPVLAREVQRDFMRQDIMHVDFFALNMSEKVTIDVPIHFINESPAVAAKLGVLITGPTVLTIETLPSQLISVIEVDLALLKNVGDSVHVRDLKLGSEITLLNDPDEMIGRISQTSAARSAEAEDLEAGDASPAEVEIIKKGKADEEEEA